MYGPRQFLLHGIITTVVTLALGAGSLSGQAPKGKGKGPLTPEPYEIAPGDPLSARALVTNPGAIKTAKSWTIETKRHRWQAVQVGISPDGALAATSGHDGMIRIWDLATGKFVRCLVGHGYHAGGVAWSPDGTMLATTGGSDGTARVWNPRTGMTLRVLKGHKGATGALAWSPNGRYLVVTGGSSGFATFWDVEKNKQLKTVEHGRGVYSVAWSPNGKMVACGIAVGSFLWDAITYENIRTMKQDRDVVYSVAFSADSNLLLTGGISNCDIWSVEDGKKLHTITGVANIASGSPDGKYLAIAATGGPVQLFDPKSFEPVRTLPVNAGSISWTPDGKLLAGVYNDKLAVYDMGQGKIKQSITVAASGGVAWIPGKPIITSFGDHSLKLWDATSGKLLHTLEGHTGPVGLALWSRDGRFLATASSDLTVRIWDGVTARLLRTHEGHQSAVSALAWSPDNKLAAVSADKIVRIFGVGPEEGRELKGHTHPVTSAAWSRDGKILATGAGERIIIWNLDSDKPFVTIQADHDVIHLSISNDSKTLVSGGNDAVMRVWSLPSGKFSHKYDAGYVSSTSWSADSGLLAYAASGYGVGIRNMKTDAPVKSIMVWSTVNSVAWTSDGKSLATGAADRSLHFWDAVSGKRRVTLIADEKQFVAVSAEGHFRTVPEVESELIYVIQTEKTQDSFEPRAFWARHAWRNNPGAVKLAGN